MDKFNSQQDAVRAAFTQVLGCTPTKHQVVLTAEQRDAVGQLLLQWYQQGLWSINQGTRAAADPVSYVTGKRPTDLIQAWVNPKKAKPVVETKAEAQPDKFRMIELALERGLISKEKAEELTVALICA